MERRERDTESVLDMMRPKVITLDAWITLSPGFCLTIKSWSTQGSKKSVTPEAARKGWKIVWWRVIPTFRSDTTASRRHCAAGRVLKSPRRHSGEMQRTTPFSRLNKQRESHVRVPKDRLQRALRIQRRILSIEAILIKCSNKESAVSVQQYIQVHRAHRNWTKFLDQFR